MSQIIIKRFIIIINTETTERKLLGTDNAIDKLPKLAEENPLRLRYFSLIFPRTTWLFQLLSTTEILR